MDSAEKFPEERVGTVEMMRNRAVEIVAVAEACDAEADEQEQAARRLRDRALHLRNLAEEYVSAAHMTEAQRQAAFVATDPTRPVGVFIVDNEHLIPDEARPDDIVFVRDPVSMSTYRKFTWNVVDRRWRRARG